MNPILKNAQSVGGFAVRTGVRVARQLPGAAVAAGGAASNLLARHRAGGESEAPASAPPAADTPPRAPNRPAANPAPEASQSAPVLSAPVAPPPPDMPGPSVTPSGNPESDVMRSERIDEDMLLDADVPPTGEDLVAREEAAAAAEAASIGGYAPSSADDPAMDPVYEAGGGEAEGFELAEQDLIENATHGDGHGDPLRDALATEAEADRTTSLYSDADQVDSTEVLHDPAAGPRDPGAGPGLPADRGSGTTPPDHA